MRYACLLTLTLTLRIAATAHHSQNTFRQLRQDSSRAAAFDPRSIDISYKPGDDFDNYANGTWKKQNPVPPTESQWGTMRILDKENQEVKIKGIITRITQQTGLKKGSEAQQIADFYRSFLDTATIDKRGITPLQPFLNKINAINTLDDWAKVNGELQPFNIPCFVAFNVFNDAQNSRMTLVFERQNGLSLGNRDYYDKVDSNTVNIRNEFVKYVDAMFRMAGFTDANAGKTLLDFETKLAKLQLTRVEQRDPVKTFNKVRFSELKTLAPQFNWDAYCHAIGIKTDTISIENKTYIKNAGLLLQATPVETLKLYTRFQLLHAFANYLPKKFDAANFHVFGTLLTGAKQQRSRLERAVRITNATLGMPLGKLFVQQYFPEAAKQKVAEMIENMRKIYGERIDQLTWMSDTTKQMARKKLATFTYKIGYPDKWKDYTSINITAGQLIENVIACRLFAHKEALAKIGKPADRTEWFMSPQTLNAYFYPLNNEIVFPAAILQPPFFNPAADDAINYGGIMSVMGHEFSHGFDDKGSQFDADGNLKNWWTAADRDRFDKLGKRYSNYFDSIEVLPGAYINGALTLGENIADLGGLTLAYYALKKSLEGKPEPALIDGWSWQQRFFLGWAQSFRENATDASIRSRLQSNPHSPARNRINAPLTHMKEFQEAWNIPPGSKMTLPGTERVVIW